MLGVCELVGVCDLESFFLQEASDGTSECDDEILVSMKCIAFLDPLRDPVI
jgi:hypothetical protein